MMKTVQRLLEALKEPTMGVMGFGGSDVRGKSDFNFLALRSLTVFL